MLLNSTTCRSINGLLELARDPCVRKRKADIYKKKELAKLGVKSISELPLEEQENLRDIFDKNVG